jgi:hypothetical protein
LQSSVQQMPRTKFENSSSFLYLPSNSLKIYDLGQPLDVKKCHHSIIGNTNYASSFNQYEKFFFDFL